MRAAVTHRDKNIVFTQLDRRTIDLFAADAQLGLRIIIILAVAQQNEQRIVVLHDLCRLIVQQMNDREGRIRDTAHRADRQGRRDRLHTVFQRQPLRHHRGNDLGGQS